MYPDLGRTAPGALDDSCKKYSQKQRCQQWEYRVTSVSGFMQADSAPFWWGSAD